MKMKCPRCGSEAECETDDIGVGEQQCGPYSCDACGWREPISEEIFDFDDEQ
jgi:predicted RNA-binding Zn-ribbon protein involved in translation (DUF1610 family)